MTDKPQRLISNMRNVRYGEVLAVFAEGSDLIAHVYGTQMLNDCPAELWDTLRADEIAKDMGALFVKLNGPRHWVLDGLGAKVQTIEPVLRDFNGLTMRRIATLNFGTQPAAQPYSIRHVNRGSQFFWDAGSMIYELVDPSGTAFVMQAYCIGVDSTLNLDNLKDLGSKINVPEGWSFRTRILDEELVCDTTGEAATVLQDELENTYTLP
jgi:hypothetical protein